MATLPEALLLWAESDPAAFDDEQQSGDDSAGVAGYLPAQRIAELLRLAVENGDVPYEGDLSEDEVDSALNELWQLQRTGSAQGVSRVGDRQSRLWRLCPDAAQAAARRERRSQASAKVQNVLHEMLAADTVAAAQHVAKDMLDAAGNELVANGLLPLLEALAAASTAETSRTAGLDVQMIATAADDVLADAQAAARLADVQAASARLAAGGGTLCSRCLRSDQAHCDAQLARAVAEETAAPRAVHGGVRRRASRRGEEQHDA